MKTPRWTDSARFSKGGYRSSADTDVTKTWAAARKKLEADKQERQEKVRELRKIGAKP